MIPRILTGHYYAIFFSGPVDTIKWFLKDLNTNSVLLDNKQPADEEYFIDGFSIKVSPTPLGMIDYIIPMETGPGHGITADGWQMEGFNGAIGNAYDNWFQLLNHSCHLIVKMF